MLMMFVKPRSSETDTWNESEPKKFGLGVCPVSIGWMDSCGSIGWIGSNGEDGTIESIRISCIKILGCCGIFENGCIGIADNGCVVNGTDGYSNGKRQKMNLNRP